MPFSFIFIRSGTTMTMALRPTSLNFYRAPKALLKPSPLSLLVVKNQAVAFRLLHHYHYHLPFHLSRRRHAVVTCSGAVTRTRRLDWKAVSYPFLEQQTSNYGRYAYQDESSDDSDREFGSTQQQMVSFDGYPFCWIRLFHLIFWVWHCFIIDLRCFYYFWNWQLCCFKVTNKMNCRNVKFARVNLWELTEF